MDKTSGRSGQIRYGPGGGLYRVVTTPGQCKGTHYVIEATEPPGGGPPLHIHRKEEEYFFVLEGEISFTIDGVVTRAGVGGAAIIPRGAVHCFKNCSDRPARVLIVFTPGGIEGFFDYGLPMPDGSVPSDAHLIEQIKVYAPKYGLEFVGPSPLQDSKCRRAGGCNAERIIDALEALVLAQRQQDYENILS